MISQTEVAALMKAWSHIARPIRCAFLKGVAAAGDITDAEFRFLRAEVLHALAMKLHGAARLCDFQNEIVVRPEGVFVDVGGILRNPRAPAFT